MSNIKPFLVPPPDNPAGNHLDELTHSANPRFSLDPPGIHLSKEDAEAMREALKPDSLRIIEHFDPKFQEQHATLIQQVKAIEKIAQAAILHADQAVAQTNASRENLALFKEQVESLSSIAQDAKSQAISTCKELDIAKQQLDFARSEAKGAKKDALWARGLSIIAIVVSIIAIIAPLLYG